MNKFAIQGHCTRGREVIAALESVGGKNHNNLKGSAQFDYYWINPEDNTININSMQYIKSHYGVNDFYTLEEYALEESDSPEKECTEMVEALNFCQTLKPLSVDVYYTSPIKEDIAHLPTLTTCETEDISIGLVKEDKGRTRLIIPEGYELKIDGDNTYLVKSKPKYPKTYDECCKVLMGKTDFQDFELVPTKLSTNINEENSISPEPPYISLINKFYKLLICRDAYWKIAGEQMGLDKPWEPDWCNGEVKWCMSYSGYCIEFDQYKSKHHILAFPTKEMRDAFYENFNEEIEMCKELL
jgi:hypothetical protein